MDSYTEKAYWLLITMSKSKGEVMIDKKEEMVYEKRIRRLVTDIRETEPEEFRRLFFLQGQASFIQQHLNYNCRSPRVIDMANDALNSIVEKTDSLVDLDIEKDALNESNDDKPINPQENENKDSNDTKNGSNDENDILSKLNDFDIDQILKIIEDLEIKTESKDKKYLIKLIKKAYNENSKD